jgi:hypothetical protein
MSSLFNIGDAVRVSSAFNSKYPSLVGVELKVYNTVNVTLPSGATKQRVWVSLPGDTARMEIFASEIEHVASVVAPTPVEAIAPTPVADVAPTPVVTSYLAKAIEHFGIKFTASMAADALEYLKPSGMIELLSKGAEIVARCKSEKHGRDYKTSVDIGRNTFLCRCGKFYSAGGPTDKWCKHLTAMLITADDGKLLVEPIADGSAPRAPRAAKPSSVTTASDVVESSEYAELEERADDTPEIRKKRGELLREKILTALQKAALETAQKMLELVEIGAFPLLVGPTGCGKTYAGRQLYKMLPKYERNGVLESWRYADITLDSSFRQSSLYGVLSSSEGRVPGVLARAFAMARDGYKVLIMVDELLRGVKRVQDTFLPLLVRLPAEDARAQGIDTDVDVIKGEADAWGVEWAPADNVVFCFGTNPWGETFDAAFLRRVKVIRVDYSDEVLRPFAPHFAAKVRQIWDLCRYGKITLPIEYGSLLLANKRDPSQKIFPMFLESVALLDLGQYQLCAEALGAKIDYYENMLAGGM